MDWPQFGQITDRNMGKSLTTIWAIQVGLADGRVLIRNLKFDETCMTFTQADGGVCDLSFRSDGFPALASSSTSGAVD